jgi:hypothetical protein
MTQLSAKIPDKLDEEFRLLINKKFKGFKKGNLQVAVTEAIECWVKQNEHEQEKT